MGKLWERSVLRVSTGAEPWERPAREAAAETAGRDRRAVAAAVRPEAPVKTAVQAQAEQAPEAEVRVTEIAAQDRWERELPEAASEDRKAEEQDRSAVAAAVRPEAT